MTTATDRTERAPEFLRSRGQRLDALDRANEVRTKRADLKRDLKAQRISAMCILAEPPAYVDTMKVWDLLLAIPKIGHAKANKTIAQCRISQSKTIGGLSQRQRDELISFLGRPAPEKHEYHNAYNREYRAATSATVHAAAHALGPRDTRTKCNHEIDSRRVSMDKSAVTCLVCVSVLRSEVRAGIAKEREARVQS